MTRVNQQNCVLIIEDELPIRSMVRHALEIENYRVREAEDSKQALAIIEERIPDLILLDWMLPCMSGIDFIRQLKKNRLTFNIPIIMLTAKAEESNKILGLQTGADDYVVKPFSPKELIARIQAVLRRGTLSNPDGELQYGLLRINVDNQVAIYRDRLLKLGPLEFRLLVFLLRHKNRVYTRDELITHVWGRDVYIEERTVDVLVRRLRKHIAAFGYDKYLQTVHGTGYRMSDLVDER